MIRRALIPLVALLALAVAWMPALAQPAAAIGKPLPDASMRDGTLMVRLIAGDRGKPVTGADVTLTMSPPSGTGEPMTQVARTDAEGRATFADIPEGALVKLTTAGPDATEVSSSQFPMPQTGGVRVMLSTLPMSDGAMGGPMAGGAPMSPRAMSGQPRAEPKDPRDTITVRLSYDDFADPTPLDGVPVALVGFRYDQRVEGRVVKTDAAGRAVFDKLDARGATSYFALTLLPRGGATDRLASIPVLLDGDSGVRVMLSAEKRTSTAPPVDELGRLEDQPTRGTIAPGEVRTMLSGVPEPGVAVELVDAVTGQVVQSQPAGAPLVDYETRNGLFAAATNDATLAPGTLALRFTRDGQPAAGVAVWARPAGSAERKAAPDGTAGADGTVTLTGLATGVPIEVVVTAGADPIVTQTYTLPPRGGLRADGTLTWQTRGEGGVRFTGVPAGADRAYVVRTTMRGSLYLSAPFQLTPERGVSITVLVYPRVMFSFSLTSWIDDVYMGVRGQFAIRNTSWAPYLSTTADGRLDELVIPLPAGFTGALVRDEYQQVVGVDPSRGFVIRRPIPPGGYQFIAGFSMRVKDGEVRWNMPLPLGSFESGIELKRDGTEARIDLGKARGAKVEEAKDDRGNFLVLSPITIMPRESMQFTVRGLPRPAAWRRWGKYVAGVAVLWVIGLTALFALWRPRIGSTSLPRARFEVLLDELAALEENGGDPARREALMKELEALQAWASERT